MLASTCDTHLPPAHTQKTATALPGTARRASLGHQLRWARCPWSQRGRWLRRWGCTSHPVGDGSRRRWDERDLSHREMWFKQAPGSWLAGDAHSVPLQQGWWHLSHNAGAAAFPRARCKPLNSSDRAPADHHTRFLSCQPLTLHLTLGSKGGPGFALCYAISVAANRSAAPGTRVGPNGSNLATHLVLCHNDGLCHTLHHAEVGGGGSINNLAHRGRRIEGRICGAERGGMGCGGWPPCGGRHWAGQACRAVPRQPQVLRLWHAATQHKPGQVSCFRHVRRTSLQLPV